jgi:hypothetical protein
VLGPGPTWLHRSAIRGAHGCRKASDYFVDLFELQAAAGRPSRPDVRRMRSSSCVREPLYRSHAPGHSHPSELARWGPRASVAGLARGMGKRETHYSRTLEISSNLEDVRVLKCRRLNNLVLLATAAASFAAVLGQQRKLRIFAEKLLIVSQRFSAFRSFRFYSPGRRNSPPVCPAAPSATTGIAPEPQLESPRLLSPTILGKVLEIFVDRLRTKCQARCSNLADTKYCEVFFPVQLLAIAFTSTRESVAEEQMGHRSASPRPASWAHSF